jgi:hypothetical protein
VWNQKLDLDLDLEVAVGARHGEWKLVTAGLRVFWPPAVQETKRPSPDRIPLCGTAPISRH